MSDQAAAVVRYEPKKLISNPRTVRGVLELFKPSMDELVPPHLRGRVERIVAQAMVAANRQPKLFGCSQESFVQAVVAAAELGLDLSGVSGEAYLVPYGKTCQLVVGFKGLAKLARQSGTVRRIEAEVVHEHDTFHFEKGGTVLVRFIPNLTGDRGDPIGAYALVESNGGALQAEWMTAHEIEKVRRVSRAGNAGPWKEWWGEMAKKTVFRRLAKWLDLSDERFNRAVQAVDAEFDFDAVAVADDATDLNKRLGLVKDSERTPNGASPEAEALPDEEAKPSEGGSEDDLPEELQAFL